LLVNDHVLVGFTFVVLVSLRIQGYAGLSYVIIE
jgi:hypothetical protein